MIIEFVKCCNSLYSFGLNGTLTIMLSPWCIGCCLDEFCLNRALHVYNNSKLDSNNLPLLDFIAWLSKLLRLLETFYIKNILQDAKRRLVPRVQLLRVDLFDSK